MATEYIHHIDEQAIVESVDAQAGTVRVRMRVEGDCAGCPASKLCPGAGGTRTFTLPSPLAKELKPGDRVTLRGSERLHRKAIMLATVLPCLALIAVMIIVYLCTGEQLAAALSGLGTMVFFFAALYAMRNHIAHEFIFTIIRTNQQ